MNHPDCPQKEKDCLFQTEQGCTKCLKCAYCGGKLYMTGSRKNFHFDHIRAYSSWGKTVVPSCTYCNQTKSNRGLKEWLRYLTQKDKKHLERIFKNNLYKKHKIAKYVRDIRKEQKGQ
jgi:hypothetical protein